MKLIWNTDSRRISTYTVLLNYECHDNVSFIFFLFVFLSIHLSSVFCSLNKEDRDFFIMKMTGDWKSRSLKVEIGLGYAIYNPFSKNPCCSIFKDIMLLNKGNNLCYMSKNISLVKYDLIIFPCSIRWGDRAV